MNRFLLSAAIVAGGLALTPAVHAPLAHAQAVTPAPEQGRTAERARPMPGERIEARLAYAKAALKITPAQEASWNALAEVLRRHARAMDEQHATRRAARDTGQTDSAIDRLQRRQETMQAASARMTEVLEAAKPLYASFSDEQKKEADALLSRGDRGGRGGHHRGRWH